MGILTIFLCPLLLLLSNRVNGDGHPNLSLLPKECGVINGENMPDSKYAGLYEFPWMVHIYKSGDGVAKCYGTVINEKYVLTVAHCAKTYQQSLIDRVKIGDYDRQQGIDCEAQGSKILCEDQFQEIEIEEMLIHKTYTTHSSDIALLRLKTPIDFSRRNASPVCLPLTAELQNKSLPGQEAVIAGWELKVDGATPSKMLKLKLPIRKIEDCNKQLDTEITGICTGGKEGICPMKSGSALMLPYAVKADEYRYVQYGITAFGTRNCDTDQWTVYTDVSKYVDWIINNIKK